jgi:hypothetical protein
VLRPTSCAASRASSTSIGMAPSALDGPSLVAFEHLLGDERGSHRRWPAGVERQMGNDFAQFALFEPVVERTLQVADQLRRDRSKASVLARARATSRAASFTSRAIELDLVPAALLATQRLLCRAKNLIWGIRSPLRRVRHRLRHGQCCNRAASRSMRIESGHFEIAKYRVRTLEPTAERE